jgi:transposase-like protein
MHLIDVSRSLGTDEKCIAFLEKMRWPDGVVRCTLCGNDKISRITRKTAGKNKRSQLYQCLEPTCKQQFSVTSGTIFNDSHLPLTYWLTATALIIDAKKGISAKQVQRHLGIKSYQTAWYLCHRIRKAMDEDLPPFKGTIEIDETYIGGKPRKGVIRKTRTDKDVVIGIRERGGKLKFVHTLDAKVASVKKVIRDHVAQDVERVLTDESTIYPFALDGFAAGRHETVQHKKHYKVPGTDIHTNTIESAFSLLKRGLTGSFHQVSIKHLHRYLSEFEFRFNNRADEELFERTVRRMASTVPMQYKQLIASAWTSSSS